LDKIGHSGTLDPMATGLLIILLNRATKISDHFLGLDKQYLAVIKLGVTTDTWDMEGKIIKEIREIDIDKDKAARAIRSLKGEYLQEIPPFSAKKSSGKPLYFYARRGIFVDKKKEKVIIYDIKIISFEDEYVSLLISCSSGTYIRSIAHDIGKMLKTGAVLHSLRRIKIGPYEVKDALKAEEMTSFSLKDEKLPYLSHFKEIAAGNEVIIKEEALEKIRQGSPVYPDMVEITAVKQKKLLRNSLLLLKGRDGKNIAFHKALVDIDFLKDYDNNLKLTKIIELDKEA
jgi:tRNA pseudouridine55 synthase